MHYIEGSWGTGNGGGKGNETAGGDQLASCLTTPKSIKGERSKKSEGENEVASGISPQKNNKKTKKGEGEEGF